MDSLLNLSRRSLVKWGLASAGLPAFSGLLGPLLRAQDAGSEAGSKGDVGGRSEEELFPANGLPGGGQLEIRLTQSLYTSDPDALEVAQRMKPFNLESWIAEWTRVADRNLELAEKAASQGYKLTANEYYLRASGFYREAAWPQPVTEAKMLPTYKKMRETASTRPGSRRARRLKKCRSTTKAKCSRAISASPTVDRPGKSIRW